MHSKNVTLNVEQRCTSQATNELHNLQMLSELGSIATVMWAGQGIMASTLCSPTSYWHAEVSFGLIKSNNVRTWSILAMLYNKPN